MLNKKVKERDDKIQNLNLSLRQVEDKLLNTKEELELSLQTVERLQTELGTERVDKDNVVDESRQYETALKSSQMNLTSANQKHSLEVCIWGSLGSFLTNWC